MRFQLPCELLENGAGDEQVCTFPRFHVRFLSVNANGLTLLPDMRNPLSASIALVFFATILLTVGSLKSDKAGLITLRASAACTWL